MELKSINLTTPKNIICTLLEPVMVETRKQLAKDYDVNGGEYKDYTGLCDIGIALFFKLLDETCESLKASNVPIQWTHHGIHGEQRHSIKIPSAYWPYQHTWGIVRINQYRFYVDPTCGQFKSVHGKCNIPDYYIDTKKPVWFYPDRKNPAYSKPFKYLNRIKIKVTGFDGEIHKEGLVEYLQYAVFGGLSDYFHNTFISGGNEA